MDGSARRISHLTPGQCRILLAAVLLLGLVGHIAYLAIDPPIELAADEAHYWDWSRQLGLSYYSKGPLVAYLIRASCALLGDTMLAVRLPALLLAVGTSLCTWWLTRRVFGSERLALGAVLLCHCVPLFIAGSMLMTIDAPFYFCWALATCFGYMAAVEKKPWAWPLVGVCVGIGFLAKYTAGLWFVCLLCFLWIERDRRALRTPGPSIALAISLLCTLPVIAWNQQHDWVTVSHVLRTTTENQSGFNPLRILGNLALMVGGQIGILNPAIAALMCGAVVRAMRVTEETSQRRPFVFGPLRGEGVPGVPGGQGAGVRYLLAMSLPLLVIVAGVTLFKPTQPNWPAPAYFALIPLAAWFVAAEWPRTKGWLIGAVAIGLVAMPLLHYSHLLYPAIPLSPRKWDPAARLRWGGPVIGQTVARELATLRPGAFVLCDKYQTAALMAFYIPGQPKTYCIGSYLADPAERDRLNQYDMWSDRALDQPALVGRDAVFVGHAPHDLLAAFERVETLPSLPILVNGVRLREQALHRCHGFRGIARPTDGLTRR